MISFSSISVAGSGLSDDRVAVIEIGNAVAFCLADGAGGSGAGAEAAESALEMFRELVTQSSEAELRSTFLWHDLVAEIDQAICDDGVGGETTVIVGMVYTSSEGTRIVGASVGDSAVWLIQGLNATDLTDGQARKPMAGSGSAVATNFERSFPSGQILIASDGLPKYAAHIKIVEVVSGFPTEIACDELIRAVRLPSGDLWDDTSVILIDCS